MAPSNLLLEEIRRLQESRESGVLVLTKLDQRVSISYREGIVQAVSSNLDTHRIGAYLTREGFLMDADVPRVLSEARREKILFGEAAVRREFLEAAELAEVVRRQATELLKHAFKNGFVRESFTKGLRSYFVSANINVAFILLELSRDNTTPFDARPETVISLKNSEDLSGVPWFPKELCVLGELNRASTFAALLASTGIEELSLKRILGVLDRLGILETLSHRSSRLTAALSSIASLRSSRRRFRRLKPLKPPRTV